MKIRSLSLALSALCLPLLVSAEPKDEKPPISAYYGFLSPEIYKLDFRTKNLLIKDINGDGLDDVIVVNNLSNRIDVLEQRKDPPDAESEEKLQPGEVNEIPFDARLKHRKIQTPRNVASLMVEDVNHDGRKDLVYLGDPPGLYIEYQKEDGSFGDRRFFEIADAQQNVWMLDVGDLNSDGRNDVAFLGKQRLYVALQTEDGSMEEPKGYRLTDESTNLIRIIDLDDDGANDIVYFSDDTQFPVRIRFQTEDKRLGAERRLSIDTPRGVSYANVDGKPGQEILIISSLSDRFVAYGLDKENKDEETVNTLFVTYPFERTGTSATNDLVVADMDGNGKMDAVVSDPDSARLVLYRQRGDQGLDQGQPFPAMLGTTLLRAADVDGDGKAEVFALSTKENSIGICKYDGERITFPQALPVLDEPLALEVVGHGESTRLLYVARVNDAETRKDKIVLRCLTPQKKDSGMEWAKAKLGDQEELDLGMRARPGNMKSVDANGDGTMDLLFFNSGQAPVAWLGGENNSFAEAPKASQGTLGNVASPAVYFGPLEDEKSALLVAQNNFARKMLLDAEGRWKVLDQYNATTASARVTGIQCLDLDDDKVPEIAMYDRTSRSVMFLKRDNGVYGRWHQLKVGTFDLRGMAVADFDGNGKEDLLLFDSDKMGVAYTGKRDFVAKPLASYESDIRNGRLFDMVPGDLNHDGREDILLLEPIQNHLEILNIGENNSLTRALRFKVFEEKTFRAASPTAEPREAVIGDVNGDGRDDIIILVHDRVLVYLQDAGEKEAAATEAAAKE